MIILLWSAIADLMQRERIDCLMGCCSIPSRSGAEIGSLYSKLSVHLTADIERVFPKLKVPRFDSGAESVVAMPRLLKGYIRAGARIGGEPAWDQQIQCADFFVWLPADAWTARYRQHFWK